MNSPLETLLSRLEKVKANGPERWVALCPAHDDKSPSLSIKQTTDGTILIRCFAGCNACEITGAIGIGLCDLFAKTENGSHSQSGKAEQLNHRQRAAIEAARKARAIEQDRGYSDAAARGEQILQRATGDASQHPYVTRKGIQPFGIYQNRDGALVIPVFHARTKRLQSIQFIEADGDKRFLPGGRLSFGCTPLRCTLESFKRAEETRIGVAEGFATSCTLAHVLGPSTTMFCAFTANNLANVATALREEHPHAEITIYADNDVNLVGQTYASKAASAVNGLIAIPPTPGADWNDFARAAL